MSRPALPFAVADISTFARALRSELTRLGRTPGHLELLNMLARTSGHGNFQHFRAQATIAPHPRPASPTDRAVAARVDRAARHFDATGRLLRWPARSRIAELCLWVLWTHLPTDDALDERQISALLDDWHVFGDHALLRRALYDFQLVERTIDGREYRRIERQPPAELTALLRQIGASQQHPVTSDRPEREKHDDPSPGPHHHRL